jgi:hypothetical protein
MLSRAKAWHPPELSNVSAEPAPNPRTRVGRRPRWCGSQKGPEPCSPEGVPSGGRNTCRALPGGRSVSGLGKEKGLQPPWPPPTQVATATRRGEPLAHSASLRAGLGWGVSGLRPERRKPEGQRLLETWNCRLAALGGFYVLHSAFYVSLSPCRRNPVELSIVSPEFPRRKLSN